MSSIPVVCYDTMSHDFDMLSEILNGIGILIDDVSKIVSEYSKLPLFDMRSITLNKYLSEEGETPLIFGSIKPKYASTIVKYYIDHRSQYLRCWGYIHGYTRIKLYFLNDNSDRCITMGDDYSELFNISDDRISSKNIYIYKLDIGRICKPDGVLCRVGQTIYNRRESYKFSAKINKLVREENHCVIYTDIAIFMIDNDKIRFYP